MPITLVMLACLAGMMTVPAPTTLPTDYAVPAQFIGLYCDPGKYGCYKRRAGSRNGLTWPARTTPAKAKRGC